MNVAICKQCALRSFVLACGSSIAGNSRAVQQIDAVLQCFSTRTWPTNATHVDRSYYCTYFFWPNRNKNKIKHTGAEVAWSCMSLKLPCRPEHRSTLDSYTETHLLVAPTQLPAIAPCTQHHQYNTLLQRKGSPLCSTTQQGSGKRTRFLCYDILHTLEHMKM